MGGNFSCPPGFRLAPGLMCATICPENMGFEMRPVGGQLSCVYKDRPEFFVRLTLLPASFVPAGQPAPPAGTPPGTPPAAGAASEYVSEQSRVAGEIEIILAKIGKDKQLKDAFQKLQDAENVRDKAPDAYQKARSAYYILKEGETWQQKERQRLLSAEVEPIANKFVQIKTDALRQYENQRKTVDVVNGLKDKVLDLKDEVKYAADTFKKQVSKVQSAIYQKRRDRTADDPITIFEWLDTILNIVIIGSLLYVIYLLYKLFTRQPVSQPAVILRG